MRTGDEPQGTALGIDRVEVEGELDAEAVRGWIGLVVGMPARIADIAVGIGADADDVVAVELLGHAAEAFVFEQAGVQGGARVQHHRPVARLPGEGLIGVHVIELGLVLLAQNLDLFRGEQLAQGDEAKGSEVLQLMVGQHGIPPMRPLERVVVCLGQIRTRPPIGQAQPLIQPPLPHRSRVHPARAHHLLSRRWRFAWPRASRPGPSEHPE